MQPHVIQIKLEDLRKKNFYDQKTQDFIVKVLFRLQEQENIPGIEKGQLYLVGEKDDNGNDIYLQFDCTFIKIKRDKEDKGYTFKAVEEKGAQQDTILMNNCYASADTKSGGFGAVYSSTIGISIDVKKGKKLQIKEARRAIKKQSPKIGPGIVVLKSDKLSAENIQEETKMNARFYPMFGYQHGAKKTSTVVKDKQTNGYISYTQMPYVEGMTLSEFFKKPENKNMPITKLLDISLEIVEAFKKLDELKISHCDINDDNIMIAEDGHIIPIDWFFATKYGCESLRGRHAWCDDLLEEEKPSSKFDLYALGKVILEVFDKGRFDQLDEGSSKKRIMSLEENEVGYKFFKMLMKSSYDMTDDEIAELGKAILNLEQKDVTKRTDLAEIYRLLKQAQTKKRPECLKASLAAEVKTYVDRRKADPREYYVNLPFSHLFQHSKKIKLQVADKFYKALSSVNQVLLRLSHEEYAAANQGELKKLFEKAKSLGIFEIEEIPEEEEEQKIVQHYQALKLI